MIVAWSSVVLASAGALAQDSADAPERPADESVEPSESEQREAQAALEAARTARAEGRFSDAIDAISRAQLADPDNGLYIYERVLVLEAMEEYELALKLIRERRETITGHPDVNDLVVVEERIQGKSQAIPEAPKVTARPGEKSTSKESGFPVLGAILTGAGGVSLSTMAVLLLVRESVVSDLESCGVASSDCADEELRNPIAFANRAGRADSLQTAGLVTGAIGLGLVAWGIFELVTHDTPSEESSGTISISPTAGTNGGGIVVKGTF